MLRRAPEFWLDRGALSTLLLPLAGIYGGASRCRRALITPQRVGIPVICIGNLVVGGAGKTPVALAVVELARSLGAAPFFLSRGYGGRCRGPVLVDAARHGAAEVGDEPLLLAAAAPTVVAKNRLRGAQFAAAHGASVIIMDDGFQNPYIHHDFSLLVVDGTYGFGNGRLLPAGPLREPVAEGLRRADAVLVMDGSIALPQGKPLLRAALAPDMEAQRLRGRKVVGFAGVSRPEKFRATLTQLGAEVLAFAAFPDHHPYREHELAALQKPGVALVTTAKDAVRLPPAWRGKVVVVNVQANISETEQLKAMLRGVLHHAA